MSDRTFAMACHVTLGRNPRSRMVDKISTLPIDLIMAARCRRGKTAPSRGSCITPTGWQACCTGAAA